MQVYSGLALELTISCTRRCEGALAVFYRTIMLSLGILHNHVILVEVEGAVRLLKLMI